MEVAYGLLGIQSHVHHCVDIVIALVWQNYAHSRFLLIQSYYTRNHNFMAKKSLKMCAGGCTLISYLHFFFDPEPHSL
jgi:hypothetical protein